MSGPQGLAGEIEDYLAEGWDCPPDAKRMLQQAAKALRDGEQQACGAPVTADRFHQICERLREVKLHVGPQSMALLQEDGWLRLSGGQRSSIVETVLDCLGIEVSG